MLPAYRVAQKLILFGCKAISASYMLSVYSVAVPPVFLVNVFKGQVPFGSLGFAASGQPLSVSSEATKILQSLHKAVALAVV